MKITEETIKDKIEYLKTNNDITDIYNHYAEHYFKGYYGQKDKHDEQIKKMVEINSNTGVLDELFFDLHLEFECCVMDDAILAVQEEEGIVFDKDNDEHYEMVNDYINGGAYVWTEVSHDYYLSQMIFEMMLSEELDMIENMFEECDSVYGYKQERDIYGTRLSWDFNTQVGDGSLVLHLEGGYTIWFNRSKDLNTLDECKDFITKVVEEDTKKMIEEFEMGR